MDTRVKDLLWATALTVVPVAVVIIIQKPSLRTALAMRFWRSVRTFSQAQADWWTNLAGKAGTEYWKATL